jgi:hypothetical protein
LGAYHELNEAYTGLENQATIVGWTLIRIAQKL